MLRSAITLGRGAGRPGGSEPCPRTRPHGSGSDRSSRRHGRSERSRCWTSWSLGPRHPSPGSSSPPTLSPAPLPASAQEADRASVSMGQSNGETGCSPVRVPRSRGSRLSLCRAGPQPRSTEGQDRGPGETPGPVSLTPPRDPILSEPRTHTGPGMRPPGQGSALSRQVWAPPNQTQHRPQEEGRTSSTEKEQGARRRLGGGSVTGTGPGRVHPTARPAPAHAPTRRQSGRV